MLGRGGSEWQQARERKRASNNAPAANWALACVAPVPHGMRGCFSPPQLSAPSTPKHARASGPRHPLILSLRNLPTTEASESMGCVEARW
jgi:hypothetical protein